MPTAPRPARTSCSRVATLLFVFSPVLVPALIVIGVQVAFLVLIVVQAFGQGILPGLGALGALIGVPWLGLVWLRAAIRVFGSGARGSVVPMRGLDDTAARYRAGDFIHRDYEAERRAREG